MIKKLNDEKRIICQTVVFMELFDLTYMVDVIICSNCGLSYSTQENESCTHCRFTIKAKQTI
jgi:transcription elongation factor Elf1